MSSAIFRSGGLYVLLLLASCGPAVQPAAEEAPQSVDTATAPATAPDAALPSERGLASQASSTATLYPEAIGAYVGAFEAVDYDEKQSYVYANKITIALDSVVGQLAYGHSVVAGNLRPFQGAYSEANGSLRVEGREPGDDRYDGVFRFELNWAKGELSGEWLANNRRLPVSKRQYRLQRRVFKYDPTLTLPEGVIWDALYTENQAVLGDMEGEFLTDNVLKFNASQQTLRKEDVENLYKGDLEVIRNAIYARHGYSFKNRKMRFIFDSYVDWYMPVAIDIRAVLTPLEKRNIDLLKRYEAHAERYYDVFGR